MSETFFWNIIHLVDWTKDTNAEVFQPVLTYLSELDLIQTHAFQNILTEKLYTLDTKAHAERIGEFAFNEQDSFSTDLFLYARCYQIAKGQKNYNNALLHPEQMIPNQYFEELLDVFQRTIDLPKEEVSNHSLSYETYSNYTAWGRTSSPYAFL